MSEEEKPAVEATAAAGEPVEEPKVEEAKAEGPKPPEWEYKKDFKINEKMRDIVQKTITVSEAQIEFYRKKLDRLTYGG